MDFVNHSNHTLLMTQFTVFRDVGSKKMFRHPSSVWAVPGTLIPLVAGLKLRALLSCLLETAIDKSRDDERNAHEKVSSVFTLWLCMYVSIYVCATAWANTVSARKLKFGGRSLQVINFEWFFLFLEIYFCNQIRINSKCITWRLLPPNLSFLAETVWAQAVAQT